jgi:hypothetical protein
MRQLVASTSARRRRRDPMASISPLLSLFKEQLEAECTKLSAELLLEERGHSLLYWYFKRLHDFSDSETEEVFCDGGGDLGIDALWIDDDEIVHFYQFKNPHNIEKGIPTGDVDKVISGLRLILHRKHESIANPDLKARLEELYQQVPSGYRIHFVSSGAGLAPEAVIKLDAFVAELKGPAADSFIDWDDQPASELQERFYQHSLPAVKDPLRFEVPVVPYTQRAGIADCYLFSVPASKLVELYGEHGEGLLQRNIRVDQRDTATNRSIEATCTGDDSVNFFHFNNGVTFLCDSASYDPFQKTLTLEKAQVVNGGQTIRALHRAFVRQKLKPDVVVPARAITSSGLKDFANNVAVNQNNQNQVGTGFLRSNDQRVVQLDHALASIGWLLERREGELTNLTETEKVALTRRIGSPIEGRVIRLKDGAQAYTATFYGQPELAKKNVKRIFLSTEDGGYYERIFSTDMTAEKIVIAHGLKHTVDEFVKRFATIRRKAQASDDVKKVYEPLLGKPLTQHSDVIHQVIPQCSLFLCGTIYKELVEIRKTELKTIAETLGREGDDLIRRHLLHIIDFAQRNKDKADRSWPVLLKSNAFFNHIVAYLSGIAKGSTTAGSSSL